MVRIPAPVALSACRGALPNQKRVPLGTRFQGPCVLLVWHAAAAAWGRWAEPVIVPFRFMLTCLFCLAQPRSKWTRLNGYKPVYWGGPS